MSFISSSLVSSEINGSYRKTKILIAVLISLITLAVFMPALKNGFINWDDNYYVYDNQYIQSSLTHVPRWAFFNFYQANWHPLTWISHAVDYAVWGLNPIGHHLVNNILHALNAFLVVFLSIRLIEYGRKEEIIDGVSGLSPVNKETLIAGAATGLLFGIHPLHVESVAWVSERKDVLSALFFCLGLLSYIKYAARAENRSRAGLYFFDRHYLTTFIFFVLALLSKPMAVTLPAVFLILDWYPFHRIESLRTLWRSIKEKTPFFVLSLAASLLTVMAQSRGIQSLDTSPLPTRLIVVSSAIISYIGKMLVPLDLIPFYPYPKHVSLFTMKYFLPASAVIGITFICVLFLFRRREIWLAVWGYYLITLLPALGIIQVGRQSMADRYTYLPSVGPFLVLGLAVARGYTKLSFLKKWGLRPGFAGGFLAIVLAVFLSFLTVMQIRIWKDSITFWSYIIEKNPDQHSFVYGNRGLAYETEGEYDLAMNDLDIALALQPDDPGELTSRGRVYAAKGMYDRALEDFSRVIARKPDYYEVYNSRGVVYGKNGLLENAIRDFDHAISLKPDFYDAYCNRGRSLMLQGRYDKAVDSYASAIKINGNRAPAYINRAHAWLKSGERDNAAADLRTACELRSEVACAELENVIKN